MAQQAADESLSYMMSKVQGSGCAMVREKYHETIISFTTLRMAWSLATGSQQHQGLEHGEDIFEQLNTIMLWINVMLCLN